MGIKTKGVPSDAPMGERLERNPELHLCVGDTVEYETEFYESLFRDEEIVTRRGKIIKLYPSILQVQDTEGRKKELSYSDFYCGIARKVTEF